MVERVIVRRSGREYLNRLAGGRKAFVRVERVVECVGGTCKVLQLDTIFTVIDTRTNT